MTQRRERSSARAGARAAPAAEDKALELIDVRAGYGRIEVLHGMNLVVPRGAVVALLGPNGAGKSTTLKVASGRLAPFSGCVHVGGNHVNGAHVAALTRAGVCTIPEGRGIFPNLTVEENLLVATHGARRTAAEVREQAFAAFPRLEERSHQLAGTLSGGEQQMLALGRAVATRPSLLLLDEISMGLAPLLVTQLYKSVAQFAEQGIAILIVEQFAHTALRVADYAALIAQGRVQAMGEPAEIRRLLASTYLGAA